MRESISAQVDKSLVFVLQRQWYRLLTNSFNGKSIKARRSQYIYHLSHINIILIINLFTGGMKRIHKELTTDSGCATTSISHHYSMNFEIGTTNLRATDRLIDNDNSEQQNDRVNRPRNENRNGVSRDNDHGGDHYAGRDYTSDNCEIRGHPNGLRPVSNGIATVQDD